MQLKHLAKSILLGGLFFLLITSCNQNNVSKPTFSLSATVTDLKTGEALLFLYNKEKSKIDTISYSKIENGSFTFDSASIAIKGPTKLTLLLKPQRDSSKATEYSKNFVIVEDKPLTGHFGVYNKLNEIPESKYHDPIVNIDNHYPDLKLYKDSIVLITKEYREEFTEQEKKDRLAETREILAKLNKAYNASLSQVVNQQYNDNDDILYKSLLLDVHSKSFKMEDFLNYADEILPQLDKTGLTYYNINDLKKTYEQQIAVEAGNDFIDFSLTDFDGNTIKLSSIVEENEIVLLDFWASWCGPCRADMPKLRDAYEEYHAKGFEVYMVSIDTKKENWIKAAEEENLAWVNTLDTKKVKDLYAVTFIPQNFLISKEGKIVAVNLRDKALPEKLKELLN